MTFTIKPPPGTPGKAWPAIVVGLFVAFGENLFFSSLLLLLSASACCWLEARG